MQLRGPPLRVPGDFRQFHPPLLFSLAKDFFIPVDVANSIVRATEVLVSVANTIPKQQCSNERGVDISLRDRQAAGDHSRTIAISNFPVSLLRSNEGCRMFDPLRFQEF